MEKEIKITPPEGYEVDKENSTFECIKFKRIKQLPKTWEEFCETHPIQEEEAYINNVSMLDLINHGNRDARTDRNILPSEKYAKAILALCQLIQLRDCYNDGWEADWTDNSDYDKWCIEQFESQMEKASHSVAAHVLAFKSEVLRDMFFENFRDLIEIAKPLL